eukprot:3929726-Alexandrium_andersonii.AAC.1
MRARAAGLLEPRPHVRQAIAAHADPKCPYNGHGDPRTSAPSNDGFAIILSSVQPDSACAAPPWRTRGGGWIPHTGGPAAR